LKFRVQELTNTNNTKLFIDGKFGMKPSPALDFAIFLIDDKFLPQDILAFDVDFSKKNNQQMTIEGSLIGYHDNSGAIDFTSEYCYTFHSLPIEVKRELEDKCEIEGFLHGNKSISPIEIVFTDESFIFFQSNTGQGSSGDPIINKNGELIGLNIGNYCDREEKESITYEKDDLARFDIEVSIENTASFDTKKAKNFNIGIRIQHPIIVSYFEKF